ncbi:MAG: ribonuclease PH [candidate division WOR-3 bacterium]
MFLRRDGRTPDQTREIKIELGYLKYAEGSCLITAGDTKVLCAATFERKVPPFLVGSGQGWITAEYNLLPRSTQERTVREATAGRVKGRNQEIQRFLGRSLRAVCDLYALGENQFIIDCDVLQADGGTRTMALTGGFCALASAVKKLLINKVLTKNPIIENVAAISVGIVEEQILVDLSYEEDSKADTDMNVVITESGKIVEIQATAERIPFALDDFLKMFNLAKRAIAEIILKQKAVCQG